MIEPHPIVAWYHRFWDDPKDGDSEEAVASREAALDVKLPPALRAMLRHTAFRNSNMIHLRSLDRLEVDEGVLLFADEQQACGFWGIRLRDLERTDPPLVFGSGGKYQPDGCDLEEFLRFLLLVDRLCEPPCADEMRARAEFPGWEEVRCSSGYAGGSLWIRGEAVACGEGVGSVGAKTNDALLQTLVELGEPAEEGAEWVQLASGPRQMPTPAERGAAFARTFSEAWVVPPELRPVLGEGPIAKADVFPSIHLYCKRCGLETRPLAVRLDAVLEAATGRSGELGLQTLLNLVLARLDTRAPEGTPMKHPFRVAPGADFSRGRAAPRTGGLLRWIFGGWLD